MHFSQIQGANSPEVRPAPSKSLKISPGETCSFEVTWDERKGKSSATNVVGNGDGQPSKGGKGGGKGYW